MDSHGAILTPVSISVESPGKSHQEDFLRDTLMENYENFRDIWNSSV